MMAQEAALQVTAALMAWLPWMVTSILPEVLTYTFKELQSSIQGKGVV